MPARALEGCYVRSVVEERSYHEKMLGYALVEFERSGGAVAGTVGAGHYRISPKCVQGGSEK